MCFCEQSRSFERRCEQVKCQHCNHKTNQQQREALQRTGALIYITILSFFVTSELLLWLQVLEERCPQCHAILEQYDEETVSVAIVCMSTLIHREPSIAAPLLLPMLTAASRIAAVSLYPWQNEMCVPTNVDAHHCTDRAMCL